MKLTTDIIVLAKCRLISSTQNQKGFLLCSLGANYEYRVSYIMAFKCTYLYDLTTIEILCNIDPNEQTRRSYLLRHGFDGLITNYFVLCDIR